MRLALAAFLSLLGLSAAAQTTSQSYRPLAIGNEWMYRKGTASISGSGTCPALALRGHVRAQVVRDTTLNGAQSRVVSCTSYDAAGTVTSTGTLAVPVAYGASVSTAGGAACAVFFEGLSPVTTTSIPNPVLISGAYYMLPSVGRQFYQGSGTGGSGGGLDERYGAGIGLTSEESWSYGHSQSPSCSRTLHTLTYALVGGETFGANSVAGEAGPGAETTVAVRAYPLPAHSSVTVEVGEAGTVEVFDALGRQVAQGEATPGRPLRLDVSGWPAGVYVARSVGASGPRASRLVVAR